VVVLHRVLSTLFRLREPAPSELHPDPPGGDGGNDALIVAPSGIPGAGLGAYADRDYEEGELVADYTGLRRSTLDVLRTPDWHYVLRLGRNRAGKTVWVDPRTTLRVKARYINHHPDPKRRNLLLQPLPDEYKARLVASRRIRKGEELFYDYGEMYWRLV
jgi:hypothetical protein